MHECVHYVFDCVLILCMNCACFNLVYDSVCVHFLYNSVFILCLIVCSFCV